jgi:hypothetical protein
MFFKTKAEGNAERLRQQTLLERHSRAAIGLSQREMSDFITARETLAEYGKTINDATAFCVGIRELFRCSTPPATRSAGGIVWILLLLRAIMDITAMPFSLDFLR